MGLFTRRGSSRRIDPEAAAEAAASGRLVIVDVREMSEFTTAHPPGARHVPLDEVAMRVAELGEIDGPVAFICRSGMRSSRAVAQLRNTGIEAKNVRGGMLAWERAGLPVETGRPRRAKTTKATRKDHR